MDEDAEVHRGRSHLILITFSETQSMTHQLLL